jgi:hypothetical protein
MMPDQRLELEYAKDELQSALAVVEANLRRHDSGSHVMSIREHAMCKFAVKRYQSCIETAERMLFAMQQADQQGHVEVDLQREINGWFAIAYPEMQRRQKELIAQFRAELDAKTPTNVQTKILPPTKWTGDNRAFGFECAARCNRGEIDADDWKDAIKKGCLGYVDKNGKTMNARNLIRNLELLHEREGKPLPEILRSSREDPAKIQE